MDKTNFQIRSVDTEARTIEGIAAPYGQTIDAGEFFERFEPGAFGDIQDVRLYSEHDHQDKRAPIGMVLEGRDSDDGFVIKARISATDKGNEVYELVRDGVLKNFSVGFVPVEDRIEDDNTVVRTKVELREVSVVAFPAYSSAQILAVRSDSDNKNTNERGLSDNPMTEINYATAADLAEVRDAVGEIDRRIAVLGDADVKGTASTQFRSAGEAVKALATNDSTAKGEFRAYEGAVLADSHAAPSWQNDLLVIVDRGRPTLNLFNKGPLPSSGMQITYPRIGTLEGDVASQANEGDNLPYLEVSTTDESAPVITYGGYSALSRQVIERSDISYLDSVLKYQAASYAKVTNAKVRSVLAAATPQTGTSFTLSSATGADFLAGVVDGLSKIDLNGEGAQPDFILVSTDVYTKMVQTTGSALAFDARGDGGRTIGTSDVKNFAGTLAGIPVVVDTGLPAKTFYVASSAAITTWESAGAPVRLQDEDIINLTKQFSLYGYMAVGVTNSAGLVKATVA